MSDVFQQTTHQKAVILKKAESQANLEHMAYSEVIITHIIITGKDVRTM